MKHFAINFKLTHQVCIIVQQKLGILFYYNFQLESEFKNT